LCKLNSLNPAAKTPPQCYTTPIPYRNYRKEKPVADIALTRAHQLGLKGAKTAADKMADTLGEKFDLRGTWSGQVFSFQRPGVNGSLAISDSDMKLEVTLGFLLKAMKGPIERAVNEQLDKVLASAKPAPKTPAKPAATADSTATKKPAARKK
jgi:putative polyhydroxyalkanoate system protein